MNKLSTLYFFIKFIFFEIFIKPLGAFTYLNHCSWLHYARCLAALILAYIAFPNRFFHFGPFIFICFIPLWRTCDDAASFKQRFRYCWLFFQLFFFSLFWMNPFAYYERYESWDMILIYGLFFMLFPLCFASVFSVGYHGTSWVSLLSLPLFLAGFEYLLTCIPGGFPLSFAIALYNWPCLIQASSVIGIYGMSGLIVFASLLLHFFFSTYHARYGLCFFLLLCGMYGYGSYYLDHNKPVVARPDHPEHVFVLIQPNIQWRDAYYSFENNFLYKSILRSLTQQSKQILQRLPDHISAGTLLFPELTLSDANSHNPLLRSALQRISQGRFNIIIGARHDKQNSLLGISPTGTIQRVYHKQQHIPLFERSEPKAATYQAPLKFPDNTTRWGLGICYELLFPQLARNAVEQGATIVGALAFNTWLGNSNWPLLHAAYLPFRSIETRRPGIFINNNGPSLVTNSHGRITDSLPLGVRSAMLIGL